jgi:hypothetical protein
MRFEVVLTNMLAETKIVIVQASCEKNAEIAAQNAIYNGFFDWTVKSVKLV